MGKRKIQKERDYWQRVWRKALHNMPGKRFTHFTEWEEVKPGITPVPEYITKSAKKLMMDERGGLWERSQIVVCWDQITLLKIMMGVIRPNFRNHLNEVQRGITQGVAPREPKRRRRLIMLGTPVGRRHVWKYLKQVGKDHLYINPEGHEC